MPEVRGESEMRAGRASLDDCTMYQSLSPCQSLIWLVWTGQWHGTQDSGSHSHTRGQTPLEKDNHQDIREGLAWKTLKWDQVQTEPLYPLSAATSGYFGSLALVITAVSCPVQPWQLSHLVQILQAATLRICPQLLIYAFAQDKWSFKTEKMSTLYITVESDWVKLQHKIITIHYKLASAVGSRTYIGIATYIYLRSNAMQWLKYQQD